MPRSGVMVRITRPGHWHCTVNQIAIEVGLSVGSRFIVICSVSGALVLGAAAPSAQIGIVGGMRVPPPVTSLKELRDQNIVKQRWDFSCGAAALATLLRYGFGESVTEREILIELFDLLSEEERPVVHKTGFSLLHLQRVAQARGYSAEGFRLKPDQLPRLGGPVIAFIQPRGYKHFAVLRGVRGDRIHLADPARGNIRVSARSFVKDWLQDDNNGIIFVVEPKSGMPTGKTRLGLDREGPSPPEMMSAREMMAVGSSLVLLSDISR